MKGMKVAAWAAALVMAGGIGAAVAPVAHGQRARIARAPQVEIFTGGSRIGVSVRDLEEADLKAHKLSTAGGALVEEVSEDSPAARAGIREGDVIVEFDGERVRSARQLTRLVQETPAGRRVQATVTRDGSRSTVTVEPREGTGLTGDFRDLEDWGRSFRYSLPPTPRAPEPPPVWGFDGMLGGSGRLGITVDRLSSQLADYFGTKDGVLVTSVDDNSPAAKAGLKAGDVITSINGTTVDEPSDVRRAIGRLDDGDEFTLVIVRDKKEQTLKGKTEGGERRRIRRMTTVL
jgi:serine protease Do